MRLSLVLLSAGALWAESNWPQYRGNASNGLGEGSPAVEWDGAKGKNVKWKTPIPGLGYSHCCPKQLENGRHVLQTWVLSRWN